MVEPVPNNLQAILKTIAQFIAPAMLLLAPPVLSNAQEHNLNHVISSPNMARQKELIYMVQQDCGSCHGMTLKGGLGPSLLPERIAVLPKQYLIEAITHGRPGTPMPPWGSLLSAGDISWIVEQLQLGQLGQSEQNQYNK